MASAKFTKMLNKSKKAESPSKKKDDKPVVELPDSLKENLSNFLVAKKTKKAAETTMKTNEAPILNYMDEIYETRGLAGNFASTFTVHGKEGESVLFIKQDKFSVNSDEKVVEECRKHLGSIYDKSVEEKQTVTLKSEVFESDELQEELAKLLGDKFDKFFNVTTKIVAKKDLKEKIFDIVKRDNNKLSMLKMAVTQAKGQLK